MKHGIYYAYWENEWMADYKKYIKKVAKLGFDVLEIGATPLINYSNNDITELKKYAIENSITLTAGYGPSYKHNIGSSEKYIKLEALNWYKKTFEVMSKLDIHWIGGALYSYWPVNFTNINKSDDWKRSVEGIQQLAPIAKSYGIDMGMEVLNRFENHIINTSKEGVEFVKEINMDNVWVMLDTFHMNIEEDSIGKAIRTAGKYLGHFHTGECNRKLPGMGHMPWREIGEALYDIKYDKCIVMEPFIRMGGQVGSDIKVWRDISNGANEEELDLYAKEALAFQHYMLDWK